RRKKTFFASSTEVLSAILVDVLLFSFQGSLLCRLFWRLLYLNKFSLSCQQKVLLFYLPRCT
ncbi:hypothetical protein, partial [Paenisporosarcina sp. TG-14]|uniref:hypothetical protein n=1 Tax=Paenisporosarcina sp. TG-14 TaxID=1231057 RepID=UPI001ED9C4A9